MSTDHEEFFKISTRAMHKRDQVEFWIDSVARALVRLESSGRASDGIDASLQKRDMELFRVCDIAANQHAVVRTPHALRTDQRDALFVCLFREGNGYTFQDVECMTHVPGDIVIYDTSTPYGHGFPGDMAMTVLDIPRITFEAFAGPWQYRGLIKIDHGDGVTCWAGQQILKRLAEVPDTASHLREQTALHILELIGSILRIHHGSASATKSTINTLWRVKEFIESNLNDDDLDCHSISRAIRLSPRQLARIFEIEGTSISRYIMGRRLDNCRAELHDPSLKHLTISEIAFRWGFSNSAHFSHSYRTRFGETPTQARATLPTSFRAT
jgi:AraC-like DNA-binding protein